MDDSVYKILSLFMCEKSFLFIMKKLVIMRRMSRLSLLPSPSSQRQLRLHLPHTSTSPSYSLLFIYKDPSYPSFLNF